MGQLNDKVIVVVGGSAGLGLAVSKRCVDEGATVVIMARGQQRLDEVAAGLGQTAVPIVCDVAQADSVRAAFAEVDRRFGKIDALLNVAGVGRIAKIADATDDDIDFVLDINLRGPILTTRSAVPLLRKAGGGDIVNVSSEIVGDYMPFMVLYGTSKGGLDTFSRMLNHELRADKIRVSNYVSGSVGGTDFGVNFTPEGIEAALPEWLESGYMTRVAGPGMEPEWMADAMVFVLTRPKGQMIDVVHVRSFAPGSALDGGLGG